MRHQVISGEDTADSFTATLQPTTHSGEQYCFQVESKLDGRWYWSVCACHDVRLSASGVSPSRVEALCAAESHADAMVGLCGAPCP